jgi:CBS domain-containing protein
MSPRPHTVAAKTGIEEAVRSLLKTGHSGAPVVDSAGALVGVLSEYDCVTALSEAVAGQWPLGRVSEHMSRDIETVPPTEDVLALAARFNQGRHRRLLVEDEGKLVGLISRRDLLAALEAFEKQSSKRPHESTYEAIEKRHVRLD